MPVSEAQKRARNKYDKSHYEYASVKLKLGCKSAIKASADRAGETLNEYIVKAIEKRMEEEEPSQ
jgi:hypothetical protein